MSPRTNFIFVLSFLLAATAVIAIPIVEDNRIDGPEGVGTDPGEDAALIDNEPSEEGEEGEEYDTEEEVSDIIDISRMAHAILRLPDNDTGKILARYSPETEKKNPEELGSYLEGDMLIPKKEDRNGLISQSSRWSGGVVPYVIRGSFNAHEMATIEMGIKEYHAKTCIRFRPRTNEKDYLSIENDPSGCWSSVGRIGGKQEVNFQTPGCLLKKGTFLHEVMHALGFLHEQNRYERDSYVDILWQNIQSSTKTNFDKATSATTHAFGVGYDYGSVMHYSAYAFSTNGRPTITAKQSSSQSLMGQRDGFSTRDLQKLNNMYCRNSGSVHTSRPSNRPQRPPSSGSRPQRPRPPSGGYPQRPGSTPQRPRPPQSQPSGNNNPLLNFLGGFINGFLQGEEGHVNDAAETNRVGQPRTIVSISTTAKPSKT